MKTFYWYRYEWNPTLVEIEPDDIHYRVPDWMDKAISGIASEFYCKAGTKEEERDILSDLARDLNERHGLMLLFLESNPMKQLFGYLVTDEKKFFLFELEHSNGSKKWVMPPEEVRKILNKKKSRQGAIWLHLIFLGTIEK